MKKTLVKKLGKGIVLASLGFGILGASGCAGGKTYFPAGKDPNLDLRLVRNSQGEYSFPILVHTHD